jgi:hypothetical protein
VLVQYYDDNAENKYLTDRPLPPRTRPDDYCIGGIYCARFHPGGCGEKLKKKNNRNAESSKTHPVATRWVSKLPHETAR